MRLTHFPSVEGPASTEADLVGPDSHANAKRAILKLGTFQKRSANVKRSLGMRSRQTATAAANTIKEKKTPTTTSMRPPTDGEIREEAARREAEVQAPESDTEPDSDAPPRGSGWFGVGEPLRVRGRKGVVMALWDGGASVHPGSGPRTGGGHREG